MAKNKKQSFIKNLGETLKPYGPPALLFFLMILLLTQFSTLSHYFYQTSDHQSIVSSVNDDAGAAVYVAKKTRWYKDNGWRPYGPVYYRLVHSIAGLLPITMDLKDSQLHPEENIEKVYHYTLMLVSLLALYGMVFIFSLWLFKSWILRLFFVLLTMSSFFMVPTWARYLFTAHPDILFCFFVAGSTFLTHQMIMTKEKKYFILSALLWGVTASTKLTIMLFAPAFFFLWFPPFNKERGIQFLKYIGIMFIGYFTIGFPQNFTLWKSINFLLFQNQFSAAPTLSSFLGWFGLLYKQIWPPFLTILIFYLLFRENNANQKSKKSKEPLYKKYGKTTLFVFLPFAFLLTRRILSAHEHYTLPFVALFLTLLVILLPLIPRPSFLDFLGNLKVQSFMGVAVFIFFVSCVKIVPDNMYHIAKNENLICRQEMRHVYNTLTNYIKSGEHIAVSSYVPFNKYHNPELVSYSWALTYNNLIPQKTKAIATKGNLYRRFTKEQPSHYDKIDSANWQKSHEFYNIFHTNKGVDKFGQKWKKVYHDKCEMMIWERV